MSFHVRKFDPFRFTQEGAVRHSDGGATIMRRFGRSVAMDGDWQGVAVMVGVQESQHGWVGKIECNPSRFRDPAGCSLMGLDDFALSVPGVLEAMVAHMGVIPEAGVAEWRVRRLDLARDFRGVTAPSVTIEGLRPLRRKYARNSSVHFDAALRGAQTLSVGTASRMVRLYDQHAAYADKGAEQGSLRWEVQLRTDALEKSGISTVSDLTPRVMDQVANREWEWSRMGTEVVMEEDAARAIDRLVRSGGLSATKAQRLLGQLVAEASGMSWTSDRKTTADYEAMKRRLGVTPGARPVLGRLGVEVPTATTSSRLDWATGFEVSAA